MLLTPHPIHTGINVANTTYSTHWALVGSDFHFLKFRALTSLGCDRYQECPSVRASDTALLHGLLALISIAPV